LLSPSDPRMVSFAQGLQKRLLHFRLSNYSKIAIPKIVDLDHLQPRTRDMARCLATPLGDQPDAVADICSLLRGQQALRPILSALQSSIISCLFDHIHQVDGERTGILLSGLKSLVNERLFESEEAGCRSEKRLGNVLTALGFTDRFRTNRGWALTLSRATRKQIHALHRTHELETRTTPTNLSKCRLCSANTGSSVPTRASGDSDGSLP